MVFSSSLPLYLDPPNWPLPQDLQQGAAGPGEINSELPHLMPPPPPPLFGGGAAASVRPASMAERARVAKVPQPETSLKCPRCESTNTKFCYFNNYSLTQPRHFCKTCRRYWTRGGALRNVPVGGGCRRNKRSKARRSKSPITNSDHQSSSTSTSAVSSNSCSTDNILGHHVQWPIPAHHQAQMSFFPHLHNLPDFGNADNIGLSSYGQLGTSGISGNGSEMEFQMGNGATTTSAGMAAGPLNLSARFSEQWRSVQPQFPFLAAGLEQFEGYGDGNANQPEAGPKTTMETAASVKQEEIHQQGPNLSRNLLGIPGNEQFWGSGNAWTDLM